MFTIIKKRKSGFTLIEMVIAITISVAITSLIVLVVAQGLRNIRVVKGWENLHSNAAFLVDVTTHWVKKGKDLEAPLPSELLITLPDFSTKSIKKTGDQITVDGRTITTDKVKVTNLNFTPLTNSVRIDFTLEEKTTTKTLSITTTVAQRNDI
jgi:prepilin-type N-terminal cleavage/methylation domain-containing protein